MLNNHHTASVPFFILFTLPFKQMSLLLILEFADCFQAMKSRANPMPPKLRQSNYCTNLIILIFFDRCSSTNRAIAHMLISRCPLLEQFSQRLGDNHCL